jgi:glutathione S-transferase
MIIHTFGPALGCIDLSPFVVKLLAWLRMADLPYTVQVGDLRKMPAAKLPAARLDDGSLLGDSQRIVDHLTQLHHDPLGEAGWTAAERATAKAFRALFETDLYFTGVYGRWVPEANWALFKPAMATSIGQMGVPGWVLPLLMLRVRKMMLKQLHSQGTGRWSPEQVAEHAISGYGAVADFLADKPFMLGDKPSALDATAFGFLHTLLVPPFSTPVKDFVASQAKLVAYHQRMLARYWPEGAG